MNIPQTSDNHSRKIPIIIEGEQHNNHIWRLDRIIRYLGINYRLYKCRICNHRLTSN